VALVESTERMESGQPLEIVVVENHVAVRMGVEAILQRAGHRIAAATDSPTEAAPSFSLAAATGSPCRSPRP